VKRIRLLSLPDPRFNQGTVEWEANRIDYRSLIEQCLRVPLDRQAGASIDEMRRGIRVLDALDKHECIISGVLELEDADWEHLKLKVDKMPWGYADRRIVRFYDDVVGATDAARDPQHTDGLATAGG
jgi:hypothetical protein